MASPSESFWNGLWQVELETPGGGLPFVVEIAPTDTEIAVAIVNASERISVDAELHEDTLTIRMPHYDSELILVRQPSGPYVLSGQWTKVRGESSIAKLQARANRVIPAVERSAEAFLGRWEVQFADDDDPAVAVFEMAESSNVVTGTILTNTGDYRFLSGEVVDGTLTLSCFDGAHAFLFKVRRDGDILRGEFWSGDWYHTTWTATRNNKAQLADGFATAQVRSDVSIFELEYPNLDLQLQSLGSSEIRGKVTIVELFGTWCPNCHDAASLLGELHDKYRKRGLKVVGLAFELTSDQARSVRQIERYRTRFNIDYPILLAGLSDKQKASESFPVLDRVRSFPTTLFIDQTGTIRAVYSGFLGPATGPAHIELRERFDSICQRLLEE